MDVIEISNKINESIPLTDEETNYFLQNLINNVKNNNLLKINEDMMKCREVTLNIFLNFEKKFRSEIAVPVNINQLGINELTHYFTLLKFETQKGIKWYIVDPVYEQFNTHEYPLGLEKYLDIKKIASKDKNKENIFNNLISKGYIELDSTTLTSYINIFVDSLKEANYDINKLKIHEQLANFCIANNINFIDNNTISKNKISEGKSLK